MELIYKTAGHIEIFRYSDGETFLFNGIVESINATITKGEITLVDGNSRFDHRMAGDMTGQVEINLNSFVPTTWAAVLGMEVEESDSAEIRKFEEIMVPDDATYKVKLKVKPEAGSVVVVDSNNTAFEETADSVGEGKFKLDDDELTFDAADAGKVLAVAYTVKAPGYVFTLPSDAPNPTFRVTVIGQAVTKADEGTVKGDALTIDRATVVGDVAMPVRSKTPGAYTITFSVLPPRPGQKVVNYVVES